MNLRKENLAEQIVKDMEAMTISEDQLIIVRLPYGISTGTSAVVGQAVVDAMRSIGKTNPVILLPKDVSIEAVNPEDMKELGYVRTSTDNTDNSRLQEYKTSTSRSGYLPTSGEIQRIKDTDINNWRRPKII